MFLAKFWFALILAGVVAGSDVFLRRMARAANPSIYDIATSAGSPVWKKNDPRCEIWVKLSKKEDDGVRGICAVIKEEFRTHCRHHGGACMNKCAPILTRKAVDCNVQTCCVQI